MAVLIDYYNNTVEDLKSVIESIQKRYLDPYQIRVTNATNNYVFIEDEINKLTGTIYGNNIIISGFEVTDVQYFDNYIDFYINKGTAICDNTIIEFTDDIILRVPKTDLDLTGDVYNIIGIDYKHVQTYPPRIAYPLVVNYNNISNYNISAVISVFKTDGTETKYLNPDNGKLIEPLQLDINGIIFNVQPALGKLNELYDNLNKTISESVGGVVIEKPSILVPTYGQTDFSGEIQSSQFKPSETFYGNHDASDWEIASDAEFTNIVDSSYNDTVNLTSYTPNNLQPETTYYVRVRYRSDYHISQWSDPVKFTTSAAYIETPTVSTTSNGSVYPTFTLTSFNSVGYNSNWQSTDWQIATDSNFTNIIYSVTKTDVPDTLTIDWDLLNINSTYYIRARYNDDQGHSSNWSSPLEYTTGLYQIEYLIPPQENELATVTTNVTHDGGKTFDTSQYVLKGTVTLGTLNISGMTATWTLPEVDSDTTASITLWVEDLSGNQVTNQLTKSLTIINVTLTADTAVSVADFTTYEYNDGWDTTV
jgi:hypothetical protein